MYQVEVEERFIGGSYSDMFLSMLASQHGTVCLGLRRYHVGKVNRRQSMAKSAPRLGPARRSFVMQPPFRQIMETIELSVRVAARVPVTIRWFD